MITFHRILTYNAARQISYGLDFKPNHHSDLKETYLIFIFTVTDFHCLNILYEYLAIIYLGENEIVIVGGANNLLTSQA